MTHTIGIFPGSFDPFHIGHHDISSRAAGIVDELVIAIGQHPSKNVLYSIQDRKVMAERSLASVENVEVLSYEDTLVDLVDEIYMNSKIATRIVLIRGLRGEADYQYEANLAFGNKELSQQNLETLFLMTSPEHSLVSSTLVREAIHYRKDCSRFLPDEVFKIVMFRDEYPSACLFDKEKKQLGS